METRDTLRNIHFPLMLRLWERISSGGELLRFSGRKIKIKKMGVGKNTKLGGTI